MPIQVKLKVKLKRLLHIYVPFSFLIPAWDGTDQMVGYFLPKLTIREHFFSQCWNCCIGVGCVFLFIETYLAKKRGEGNEHSSFCNHAEYHYLIIGWS